MELPVVQSLWVGDRISALEKLCISSFLANSISFHLYVYGPIQNIPEGTTLKDAGEIIPPSKIFTCKRHNSYAGFADLFRYKLLLERGGYWVDTDIICVRPFDFHAPYVFASEHVEEPQEPGEVLISNCVIKSPPGAEIMQYCYDESNKCDIPNIEWGDLGPTLISRAVKALGMEKFVVPPHRFCPVPWWEWKRLASEPLPNFKLKGADSIHFWNEMWRRSDWDKSDNFQQDSLYESLKRKYSSNIIRS